MTPDYWSKRASKYKQDIEHINEVLKMTVRDEERQRLKSVKQHLVSEQMICIEAIEQFS